MIPKIIHQIWWQGKDKIPKTYPNHCQSWKDKNKNFKYIFWDEEKIMKLLESYPHLKNKFNEFANMIQKIDMAKYIILHKYGGLYVDVDSECLKPIENLLKDKQVVLVQINVNPFEKLIAYGKIKGFALQNGVMAGVKDHPFWLHCLDTLVKEDIIKKPLETNLKYIFRTTGPGLLTNSYISYPKQNELTITPHTKVDPVSWCNYEVYNCANESCAKYYPEAYSLHHFGSKHGSHNWTNGAEKKIGLIFCQNKKLIYSILLVLLIALIFFVLKRYQKI